MDKVWPKAVHLAVEFRFSDEKDEILARTRGVSFTNVIEAIAEHGILMEYENPNYDRYPGQRIMVVRINDYPHCVPFLTDGAVIELKTVYPSRRFRHLLEEETDDR